MASHLGWWFPDGAVALGALAGWSSCEEPLVRLRCPELVYGHGLSPGHHGEGVNPWDVSVQGPCW